MQEENRRSFNAKRKEAKQYQVGDLVAINKTQFSTGAKLKPKNAGPYAITKAKGNERYDVERIGTHDGPSKTNSSADNLKAWPTINMMSKVSSIFRRTYTSIAVEGNIGAGKSSLMKYFAQIPNCETHPEPVERWTNLNGHNLLDLMYSDDQRFGPLFQSYALLTTMENYVKPQTKPFKLIERSFYSIKYCFLELMEQRENAKSPDIEVIKEWMKFLETHVPPKIDRFVYIRTTPEVSYHRLLLRNRAEETQIPFEYIQKLHTTHEQWLLSERDTFIINGNLNNEEILTEYQRLAVSLFGRGRM